MEVKNWPASHRRLNAIHHYAQFKGVKFEVEAEGTEDAGRLVALHPFVKAESHATEDMGRKARRFSVVAYIAGNYSDSYAQRLVEACSSPGAGQLVLPVTPPQSVRCIDCSTANDKRRQGYVAFRLQFIESGLETGGFPVINLGDVITGGLLDDAPRMIQEFLIGAVIGID